jgi:hypothetical protein
MESWSTASWHEACLPRLASECTPHAAFQAAAVDGVPREAIGVPIGSRVGWMGELPVYGHGRNRREWVVGVRSVGGIGCEADIGDQIGR